MTALLIIIGIALLLFAIWNLITLRRLKNVANKKDSQLNDSKYYELKYKTEFIIAVFTIAITVAGLLGYKTIEGAKEEIKKELLKETTSIDSLLIDTKNKAIEQDSILEHIELKQEIFNTLIPKNQRILNQQNYQIKELQSVIDRLNNSNKIKKNFYLVSDLKLENPEEAESRKNFKFEDLRTNSGDRLPKFTKPPYLVIIPNTSVNIDVIRVSLTDFDIGISSWTEWEYESYENRKEFIFSLMVIENK